VQEKFYSRKDVELILKIKHWMVVERIEKSKVKEKIKEQTASAGDNKSADSHADEAAAGKSPHIPRDFQKKLRIIRQNLQEILTILDKNDKK
jgi:hypothetical protein